MGRLIVLCGLAGAGKTTLAKELEAEGAVRMCPDEWMQAMGFDLCDKDARERVEALQWEQAQLLLLRGLTVVDECGCWQRWERDLRREWARAHGIAVELRLLDAPVEELVARVEARNRALPQGVQGIDPGFIALWDERIQRPDAAELALFDPPAEPAVPGPRLRHSARAILVTSEGRVLLHEWHLPKGGVVWGTPGGGVEAGEAAMDALRRELIEEVGHELVGEPPHVWRRTAVLPGIVEDHDGTTEDAWLVPVDHFEPAGTLTAAEAAAEGIGAFRWWTLDEIEAATDLVFAPRDLAAILRSLLDDGPPETVLQIGL